MTIAKRMPISINVFLHDNDHAERRRYLVFRRPERKDLQLPSFWQGVTGAVEKGETLEAAAIREVKEETGIDLEGVHDTGFSFSYPIQDAWKTAYPSDAKHITEHVFFAKVVSDPVLSKEHTAFRWVTFAEGLTLLTFGANPESLERVERYLNDFDTLQ